MLAFVTPTGRESTVSIYDLALCPRTVEAQQNKTPLLDPANTQNYVDMTKPQTITHPVQTHKNVSTEVTEIPGSRTAEVKAHKIVFPVAPRTRGDLFVKNGDYPLADMAPYFITKEGRIL